MSAATGSAAGAGAAGVVSLALAFHRMPASHADLLHGAVPLPESLGVLLRLAAGISPADVCPSIASLASSNTLTANDLRVASLFFIEQVLFRHDANYFRVLGVNPGASLEQIKEHHRLLMRLFHPDRTHQPGGAGSEWKEAYATRVNLAYNTLRDADSRSRYLASLKAPTSKVLPVRPAANATTNAGVVSRVAARRMATRPDSFWAIHLEPLFKRYLAQWVLGGTALLALLLIGVVHLANPPIAVADSTRDDSELKPNHPLKPAMPVAVLPLPLPVIEEAKVQALNLDAAIARFENRDKHVLAAALKTEPTTAPTTAASPLPETRQTRTQAPQIPPKPIVRVSGSAQPTAKFPANQVVAPAQAVWQSVAPVMPEAKPVQAPTIAVQVAAKTSVQMAQAPLPTAEPAPVQWNPDTLLGQLTEAYERGDTQELMDMFDELARTEAGGRAETRRNYEALFRSTDLRDLRLDNITWSGDGEVLRGQGKYRLTQMRRGEPVLKTQSGILRIELIRRGRSVLISALYLTSGRP